MSEEKSCPRGDEHKHDGRKARWDLLPMDTIEDIVWILTYGAGEYADNGWYDVPDPLNRYYAALQRHLAAYLKDEYYDSESRMSHLAHAGCNLIFLLSFERRRNGRTTLESTDIRELPHYGKDTVEADAHGGEEGELPSVLVVPEGTRFTSRTSVWYPPEGVIYIKGRTD